MGNGKTIGTWPDVENRDALVDAISDNLKTLANLPKGDDRLQLQREIHQRWNCFTDSEKITTLEDIGQLAKIGKISPMPTIEEAVEYSQRHGLAEISFDETSDTFKALDDEQRKAIIALKIRGP